MKTKTIILTMLVILSLPVSAQQLRYGVLGGMNITNTSYDSQIGYHFGAKVEMDAPFIREKVYFEAALMLSQKPLKTTADGYIYDRENENTMNLSNSWKAIPTYLELPIHVGYRFKVGNDVSLFVKGGPYMALGVFVKVKTWQTIDGAKVHNVKESVFKNHINRFDWGVGLRVGAEFLNHYQISIGHDWGLKDFEKNHPFSSKHRTFTLSVSYIF